MKKFTFKIPASTITYGRKNSGLEGRFGGGKPGPIVIPPEGSGVPKKAAKPPENEEDQDAKSTT